jgi:hypothetical protein
MSVKLIGFLFFISFITFHINAQEVLRKPQSFSHFENKNKLWIGLEMGLVNSLVSFSSEKGTIEGLNRLNRIYGITMGYSINNKLVFETGLLRQSFSNAFILLNEDSEWFFKSSFYTGNSGFYKIPLRIRAKVPIVQNKVFLVTHLEVSSIYHSEYGFYDGGVTQLRSTILATGVVTENYLISYKSERVSKTNLLVEGRIGIEFLIAKKYLLTVSGGHSKGWKNYNHIHVEYFDHNGFTDKGIISQKGDSYNIIINISYPIGE